MPFQPSDLSGLQGWYDASSLGLANNAAVPTWTDRSAATHDLAQAFGGYQPTYKTAILNGLAVVRFGGDHEIKSGSWGAVVPQTRVIVGKVTALAGSQTFADGSSQNTALIQAGAANYDLYAGNYVFGPATDTAFHTVFAEFNGASSNIRVDGGPGTDGNTGSGVPGGIVLGCDAGHSAPLTGDIAEVLVYDRILTATEKDQVGNYLATKYGLTWTNIVSAVTVAGPATGVALASPAGKPLVSVPGPVSGLSLASPVGTPTVTVSGATATLLLASPVGGTTVAVPGPAATVALLAPAGALSIPVTVAAAVCTLRLTAPSGSVAGLGTHRRSTVGTPRRVSVATARRT